MCTVIVSVRWKWLDNQNVIKLRVCDVANDSTNGLCTCGYDHKPNIDVINFSDYVYNIELAVYKLNNCVL